MQCQRFTAAQSPTASEAPTEEETAFDEPSQKSWTAAELRYLKAEGEKPDSEDAEGTVSYGHEQCKTLRGAKGIERVLLMIEDSPEVYENEVKYLCPKYRKQLTIAERGFSDGNYSVGRSRGDLLVVKPGRYRTQPGTRDCYWERSTKGGKTIANDFVTNAPSGVTVTIYASDGGFSSDGCGAWLRQ